MFIFSHIFLSSSLWLGSQSPLSWTVAVSLLTSHSMPSLALSKGSQLEARGASHFSKPIPGYRPLVAPITQWVMCKPLILALKALYSDVLTDLSFQPSLPLFFCNIALALAKPDHSMFLEHKLCSPASVFFLPGINSPPQDSLVTILIHSNATYFMKPFQDPSAGCEFYFLWPSVAFSIFCKAFIIWWLLWLYV